MSAWDIDDSELGETHLDTAWQSTVGEEQLKVELIWAFRKPPISAQDNFIFEQGREATPRLFSRLLASSDDRSAFAGRPWLFVDLNKAVQTNDQMSDADGLRDAQKHVSGHGITGRVFAMLIIRIDGEFGYVARSGGGKRR